MEDDVKDPPVLNYGQPILDPEEAARKKLVRRVWTVLFAILATILVGAILFLAAVVLIEILNFARAILVASP